MVLGLCPFGVLVLRLLSILLSPKNLNVSQGKYITTGQWTYSFTGFPGQRPTKYINNEKGELVADLFPLHRTTSPLTISDTSLVTRRQAVLPGRKILSERLCPVLAIRPKALIIRIPHPKFSAWVDLPYPRTTELNELLPGDRPNGPHSFTQSTIVPGPSL